MKKPLLFVLLISIFSCSSDDPENIILPILTPEIVVNIDGVLTSFDNISITETTVEMNNFLTITGRIGNSNAKVITFFLENDNATGNDLIEVTYSENTITYEQFDPDGNSSILNTITVNDGQMLQGTFSGDFDDEDEDDTIEMLSFTNGTFNIQL